jgi:hypothetical protein
MTTRFSVLQAVVANAERISHHRAMQKAARVIVAFFCASMLTSRAMCAPLVVPFDFSRSELGLKVSIKGKPLYAILDTGVDPSVIDLADAKALGLKFNQSVAGEAGGFGDGRSMTIFPGKIEGLTIAQRVFPSLDALASDMSSLSHDPQSKLSMVLGYSFLSDKIVLIDYVTDTLAILDTPDDAKAMVSQCHVQWAIPLRTLESYPVIPNFRFGESVGPVTLDTGSNSGIGLFRAAMTLPGMKANLVQVGSTVHRGARGASKVEDFTLNEPVGFGPFTLPPGQEVFVNNQEGSAEKRVANIGNTLLKDLKIKILLDYRRRFMTFYGRCS